LMARRPPARAHKCHGREDVEGRVKTCRTGLARRLWRQCLRESLARPRPRCFESPVASSMARRPPARAHTCHGREDVEGRVKTCGVRTGLARRLWRRRSRASLARPRPRCSESAVASSMARRPPARAHACRVRAKDVVGKPGACGEYTTSFEQRIGILRPQNMKRGI